MKLVKQRKLIWYEDVRVLRQQRLERGFTQKELGDEAKLKQSVIAEIESGKRAFTPHYRDRVWPALFALSRARNLGYLSDAQCASIREKADELLNKPRTDLEDCLSQLLFDAHNRIVVLERQVENLRDVWESGVKEALAHEELEGHLDKLSGS
jgi:transcriptional regulator with XRE-family HTH domain